MVFKHVWFDFDGTLIDSAPAILSSINSAFVSVGVKPAHVIDSEVIGPPLRDTIKFLADSDDDFLIDQLVSEFKRTYDSDGYRKTFVFDGVEELISELSALGFELAIATNKRIYPTRLILDNLCWDCFFSRVYALDVTQPPLKNKQIMLTKLLADSRVDPSTVVYVGDRMEDGLSAQENNISFVAVTWGYGAISDSDLMQNWKAVSSPAQLMNVLRQNIV